MLKTRVPGAKQAAFCDQLEINSRAKSPVLRFAPSCPAAAAALVLCSGHSKPECKNKLEMGC